MSDDEVPLGDMTRTTGATYRQLNHWVRSGYLRPLVQRAGSGYPRHWPKVEREVCATMVRLISAGLLVRHAAQVARRHVVDGEGRVELAPGVTILVEPLPGSDANPVDAGD